MVRVRGKEPEQVEFLDGQLQELAVSMHLTRGCVERQLPDPELLGPWRRRGRAPKHRAYPRRQLPWRERLRDVVVGAELEPDDTVGLLAAGGQQDHGQIGVRPDPATEREPVDPRQHHVEDDEAWPLPLENRACRFAVGCGQRSEPVPLQVAHNDVQDDRVVVDDKNGGHNWIVHPVWAQLHLGASRR